MGAAPSLPGGRSGVSGVSADRNQAVRRPDTTANPARNLFWLLPALIVRRGHEGAASLLLSSFVSFLEGLARRDVMLHGMGTISCSPGGAQVCRDLGMTRLGDYQFGAGYGVWELPGAAISASLFARRSPMLRHAYAEAFPN